MTVKQKLEESIRSLLNLTPQARRVNRLLGAIDVQKTLATPQNHAPAGTKVIGQHEVNGYTITHVIENGIERVTYTPREPKFATPILMMHGMWHGAWCWKQWQELFAAQGWTSVAFSLPGHGESPTQKPTTEITLDYYLAFLRDEVQRLSQPPVLIGHSMGGALTQWYLRHVSDALPAVVLLGSWVHDSAEREGFSIFFRLDPIGVFLIGMKGDATPFIRTPQHAAQKLISHHALYSPEELHARLSPESAIVMMQHNPPFWEPPRNVHAPILCIAGEKDAVLSVSAVQNTARFYNADFVLVPDAAHNLMMDAHYQETAMKIHHWLQQHDVH